MSVSRLIRSRHALRIAGFAFGFAGLLWLCGCWVYSVEPLYDESASPIDPDLTADRNLVGQWVQVREDCPATLAISADDVLNTTIDENKHRTTGTEPRYELILTPSTSCKSDDKPTRYDGHLVKVGDHRFLDVFPKSDEVCDLCLPMHSFMLVAQANDRLDLIPLNRDWLMQAISDNKVNLPYLPVGHGTEDPVALTASSRELKDFVRKYAADKAAFEADSRLTLRFKRK